MAKKRGKQHKSFAMPFGLEAVVECACTSWGSVYCDCTGIRWRLARFTATRTCYGPWRSMTSYWHLKRLVEGHG